MYIYTVARLYYVVVCIIAIATAVIITRTGVEAIRLCINTMCTQISVYFR